MNGLNILFATNFSEACNHAIVAIRQLTRVLPGRVTLACSTPSETSLQQELAFFADADPDGQCRRLELPGVPEEAIATLSRSEHFDLIVAPGSGRTWLPRPFHPSFRAHLLGEGGAPVWTGGRMLGRRNFSDKIRTIAVGLDGGDTDLTHVRLAASLAERVGAQLRLLTVVPAVDEGTLVRQAWTPEPLHPATAVERIQGLLAGWHHRPTVDVSIGAPGPELRRMASRCEADLLFLTESQSVQGWFGRQISRTVDSAPCPVICVPSGLKEQFQWTFQKAAETPLQALLETQSQSVLVGVGE